VADTTIQTKNKLQILTTIFSYWKQYRHQFW